MKNKRVLRGGGWYNFTIICTVSYVHNVNLHYHNNRVGLRIVIKEG